MTVHDLEAKLGYTSIQPGYEDTEITSVYTSDLLSDVMAHAEDASILVTIQAHKNTIAVCSLSDIRAVVICNDRPVPDDMISAAEEEGVGIFRTSDSQFIASGKLYDALRL